MPIFVWIYRITWIRDKAGFFFIFLIFLFNWYNCYLKSTRTWTKLYMHINIQVQNLGKIQSSLSKNFISKMFLSNPTKKYMIKRVNLSFKIDFHSVELLELFMINKMFNFFNGNWKINKMHLTRTNKSNESATERHAEISRLQINIEESNASGTLIWLLKKYQPRKRQGIIKWKVLSYIF